MRDLANELDEFVSDGAPCELAPTSTRIVTDRRLLDDAARAAGYTDGAHVLRSLQLSQLELGRAPGRIGRQIVSDALGVAERELFPMVRVATGRRR